MTSTPRAHVAGSVLRWARESIGLTEVAAARKANVPDGRVAEWEAGSVQPTIAQLRKLAAVYKRPLAVFFLPSPPSDFEVTSDFLLDEPVEDVLAAFERGVKGLTGPPPGQTVFLRLPGAVSASTLESSGSEATGHLVRCA